MLTSSNPLKGTGNRTIVHFSSLTLQPTAEFLPNNGCHSVEPYRVIVETRHHGDLLPTSLRELLMPLVPELVEGL